MDDMIGTTDAVPDPRAAPGAALPAFAPPKGTTAGAATGDGGSLGGAASLATYAGRTILVTGAGGSIGLELCRRLLSCGPARLVLFDLSEAALCAAERALAGLLASRSADQRRRGYAARDAGPARDQDGPELIPVLGSAADAALVRDTLTRHAVDVVIHAAAYKHVHLVEANVRAGFLNNTLATLVLAQQARDAGVARMILVSTDKANRPAGVMGATKRLAEIAVQDMAARPGPTAFGIVRFGNVAGSSGSVIPLFRAQIAAGGPVTLTHADATRYFMTAADAAGLVLTAGALPPAPGILALDMGQPVAIADLARALIREAGLNPRDAAHPDGDIAIVALGLRPGEKLHEDPMPDGASRVAGTRIFRIAANCPSEIEVAGILRQLRDAAETGSDADLRRALWRAMAIDREAMAPSADAAQDAALAAQGARAARAGSGSRYASDLPAAPGIRRAGRAAAMRGVA